MKLSKSLAVSIATVAVATASASAALMVPTQNCSYSFTKNLKMGSKSSEVMNLQKVLNMYPQTRVAEFGAGSPGMETMKFGPATRAAVVKLQNMHEDDILAPAGLSRGSGSVYGLTRAVLNQICTGNVGNPNPNPNPNPTPGPVTSGPVSVMLAPVQPMSVLVTGQAAARIAEFVLSGNGTVSQIELMRTGVSSNDTLKNVYLYDGATRLTDSSSVLTDGTIRFSSPITVSGTRNISVRADIEYGTSGQTVGVMVKSITVAGGSMQSVLGLQSGLQAVANATLAKFSYSSNAQSNIQQTISSGSVNQNLWDVTWSVSERAVDLKAINFKYTGSANYDAIANLDLYVDGVKVGSTGFIGSNGMLTFDLSSMPFRLTTGQRQVQLRGDFVKGSSRSAQFYIQNASDIMVEDSQLKVNVTPCSSLCSNTVSPWPVAVSNLYGYNYQIQNGNLTINVDPTFTQTTVVGGGSNVTLGRTQLKAFGEDIKIETLSITPVEVSALTGYVSGHKIPNVGVYVNGAQIGSSKNWTSGNLEFTLGSQLIVAAGSVVTLEFKGDLKDGAGNNYTAGQVRMDINTANTIARGQNSQNSVTPAGSTQGRSLTVNTSNATFSRTGGFSGQTVSPNGNTRIGSFTISNGDNENIRVTNLAVNIALGAGMTISNVTNLRVTDSSVIISTPVVGANNFTFDVTVPRNLTKTFEVTADLGSAAGVTATITTTADITYRGVNSGVSSPSVSSGAGVAIVANTATLVAGNITLDSSSPVQQLVIGTNSSNIATYKVVSPSSSANLTEMTFTVSPSSDAITMVKVGGISKTTSGGSVTLTGLNIAIPTGNSGVLVPVEVTYGNVNSNGGIASQATALTYITLTSVKYNSGNTVVTLGSLTAVSNSMQLVSSKPSLTVNSTQNSGLSIGENKLGEVTVTADEKGNITLKTISFDITGSGITGFALSGCKIVEGTSGSTMVTGSSATTCTTTSAVFSFGASGSTLPAKTSRTYSVYGTVAGTLGNSGTSAISSKLSVNTTFIWDDVNGGGTNLPGTNINNYPTGSYTLKN